MVDCSSHCGEVVQLTQALYHAVRHADMIKLYGYDSSENLVDRQKAIYGVRSNVGLVWQEMLRILKLLLLISKWYSAEGVLASD